MIGSEGLGKCNSNCLLLLRKCAEHDLLITNTVFKLPNRNKTSWMHPRSKHWHLIDYVIVRRTDRQDVRVTKTMCGANCWTDHRLVVGNYLGWGRETCNYVVFVWRGFLFLWVLGMGYVILLWHSLSLPYNYLT